MARPLAGRSWPAEVRGLASLNVAIRCQADSNINHLQVAKIPKKTTQPYRSADREADVMWTVGPAKHRYRPCATNRSLRLAPSRKRR